MPTEKMWDAYIIKRVDGVDDRLYASITVESKQLGKYI